MSAGNNIQYGPPPLRPGYRWETAEERDARLASLAAAGLTPRPVQGAGWPQAPNA